MARGAKAEKKAMLDKMAAPTEADSQPRRIKFPRPLPPLNLDIERMWANRHKPHIEELPEVFKALQNPPYDQKTHPDQFSKWMEQQSSQMVQRDRSIFEKASDEDIAEIHKQTGMVEGRDYLTHIPQSLLVKHVNPDGTEWWEVDTPADEYRPEQGTVHSSGQWVPPIKDWPDPFDPLVAAEREELLQQQEGPTKKPEEETKRAGRTSRFRRSSRFQREVAAREAKKEEEKIDLEFMRDPNVTTYEEEYRSAVKWMWRKTLERDGITWRPNAEERARWPKETQDEWQRIQDTKPRRAERERKLREMWRIEPEQTFPFPWLLDDGFEVAAEIEKKTGEPAIWRFRVPELSPTYVKPHSYILDEAGEMDDPLDAPWRRQIEAVVRQELKFYELDLYEINWRIGVCDVIIQPMPWTPPPPRAKRFVKTRRTDPEEWVMNEPPPEKPTLTLEQLQKALVHLERVLKDMDKTDHVRILDRHKLTMSTKGARGLLTCRRQLDNNRGEEVIVKILDPFFGKDEDLHCRMIGSPNVRDVWVSLPQENDQTLKVPWNRIKEIRMVDPSRLRDEETIAEELAKEERTPEAPPPPEEEAIAEEEEAIEEVEEEAEVPGTAAAAAPSAAAAAAGEEGVSAEAEVSEEDVDVLEASEWARDVAGVLREGVGKEAMLEDDERVDVEADTDAMLEDLAYEQRVEERPEFDFDPEYPEDLMDSD